MIACRWAFGPLLLLILPVILTNSCVVPQVSPPQGAYHVVPLVSYLRDCPEYDCKVVGTLYRADTMEFLDQKNHDWWQMRSERTGQTGWIQSNLLSREPVPVQTFYVLPEKLPLRECPNKNCPVSKMLMQGEQVQKIDDEGGGWWRVLVEKDKIIGWIPVDQVSETPVKVTVQPAKESVRFVYPASLNLHVLPLTSSRVVKILSRNEKVEKLYESSSEWLKVRHLSSGAEGWTMARFLRETPVFADLQIFPKKKRPKKEPAKKKPHQEAPSESERLKPEVM